MSYTDYYYYKYDNKDEHKDEVVDSVWPFERIIK